MWVEDGNNYQKTKMLKGKFGVKIFDPTGGLTRSVKMSVKKTNHLKVKSQNKNLSFSIGFTGFYINSS